ncbi:CGNR zinc finger domain-containing protein [Priestia endophytica]|uniref:CGNR zinc finger domain-containing protein n=1 Tax=Priestia endophytica TaxID=135735 RepID=UPI002282BD05|nr:CGNR zinc finger domain-containing protein [Priestia endophytica]MCY8231651.1 CGNR zinc finger domain-containing protein [Priestia endophytica]
MSTRRTFPLISGSLSLDLVNTEVVSYGHRRELLTSEQDFLDWLYTMCEAIPSLDKSILNVSESDLADSLETIYRFRFQLRENFEAIADGKGLDNRWISDLEENIEKAPFVYKIESGEMKQVPKGTWLNKVLSLVSLDALKLTSEGKLDKIRRCSNTECVLLFIDITGRRKWCSMKICGNRKKVTRFQSKGEIKKP